MALSEAPLASPPQPPGCIGSKLLPLLTEKPKETLAELGALLATLATLVSGLGFVTLRAREALLGLSPGLSYPKQEWLQTGVGTLGSLLSRGLSVLISDHPILWRSAWALVVLVVTLVLVARLKCRPAVLVVALGASALFLIPGVSFYRIALAATSPQDAGPSRGFHCGQRLSANLFDQAAVETCSWLVNDSPSNNGRRSDLAGLLGWLLAACLAAAVAGARAPISSRWLSRLRWGLVGVHALFGLLLLFDLPRAYAFANWGLRYPQVQIQENCDKALAQAIAKGKCWAFDVSADSEKKVIYTQGVDCPEGRNGGFVPLKDAECLITLLSPPKAIGQ